MRLLLDTHVLLWWLAKDSKLSEAAQRVIAEADNLVFFSAATIWEIRIKEALGKISLPSNFMRILSAEAFEALAVSTEHADRIASLPPIHRDPFDRMLIAQSLVEELTLVSHDSVFSRYETRFLQV